MSSSQQNHWQTWPNNQPYQRASAQYPNSTSSQMYPRNPSFYSQPASHSGINVQPHYGTTSPAPVIAELPAPLPPAPPTTTSDQQLKEDELFAHKIQQLDLEEVRRRSSSTVSYQQRPPSIPSTSPQRYSPLVHQQSTQSLRPHSQSLPSVAPSYSPDSLRPRPSQPSLSILPEVVVGPRPVSYLPQSPSDNLPIPVLQDQLISPPPPALLDPLSLSAYLEQYRQVPYPPQWILPPALAIYYARSDNASSQSWLDTPDSCLWGTARRTAPVQSSASTSFTFKFKSSNGSFRSPKHSWTLTCPEGTTDASRKLSKSRGGSWTYDLKLDSNTGLRKSEILSHGREKSVLTTYVHALNYDSLRFIGPDGCAYMWVSSTKLSSINGSRYDTMRHALFVATGNIPDPLYGQIVADHTFWDGYINDIEVHEGIKCAGCHTKPINGLRWKCRTCPNQDICNTCRTRVLSGQLIESSQATCNFALVGLPDEALCIRSPNVDPALVVATLQILKDWERHTLREEKRRDIKGFSASEETARKCDLGVMAYWRAEDWNQKIPEVNNYNTTVKASQALQTTQATHKVKNSSSTVLNLADAGLALGRINGLDAGRSTGDEDGAAHRESPERPEEPR